MHVLQGDIKFLAPVHTRFVAMECSVETKEVMLPDLLRWVVYAESEVAAVSMVVGTQPNVISFDKTNLHD